MTTTVPIEDDDAPLRRHFVAIATGTYDDAVGYGPLPVADEVNRLAQWLTDDPALGARRFTPAFDHLRDNPSKRQIQDAFEDPGPGWRHGDAAVVYLTGHGEKDDDNTHWTILRKTKRAELARTALRTRDLLDWLRTTDPVGHLLFIVDSCHAGAVIPATGVQRSNFPSTWFVLTSTSEDHTAATLALARAVSAVMADLASPEGKELGKEHRAYLSVADFLSQLRRRLADAQFRHAFVGDPHADHFCLPNPHYAGPQVVDTASQRRDLAIPVRDLRVHWQPRALGSGDANRRDTPGGNATRWLFTGRQDLMRELIATARGDRDEQALVTVVTGGAGCGKSAVLARLVTLSDPTFLARYPSEVAAIRDDLKPVPSQGVDVALLATGKYPEDILRQLADALIDTLAPAAPGVAEREHLLAELTKGLATRTSPVTVVLDALDEARDPKGIVQTLTRLTTGGRARLLVGVRSPARPDDPLAPVDAQGSLADAAVEALKARRLQVDADPWWHQDDVRRYAESILLHTPGSPYTAPDHHPRAAALATVISEHVRRTFLVTRLAAEALTARPDRIDPTDQSWRATLDDGVVGVFRADLHETYRDDAARRLRAVHLLRAVAFAYGRGVPWRDGIWAAMANAVADLPHEYGSADIADLLSSRMGAYLVTDVEDDITVYRLFHDALRGTLRDQWRKLVPTP